MQDNTPPHKTGHTMPEFTGRNISYFMWPRYSPDLSPIEFVWNFLKDYMQRHYPELGQGRHRGQYRQIVREAWDLGFEGNDLENPKE